MQRENLNKCCEIGKSNIDIDKCDIFNFMANVVGLAVLHPAGFKGTDKLAELCKIGKDTEVLDVACGKGTSAYYLSRKFGCPVTGIDISEVLLRQAERLARKKKMENKLTFKIANAENLPFSDNEFDVSILQAVLVLVDNKKQAIKEAIRVTKPGGYVGILELSWQKQPTEEFFKGTDKFCATSCMRNVQTYNGWRNLIFNPNLEEVKTCSYKMQSPRLIKDEGICNAIRVMTKWMFNSKIRNKMNMVDNFFEENSDIFGYGIYVGRKVP